MLLILLRLLLLLLLLLLRLLRVRLVVLGRHLLRIVMRLFRRPVLHWRRS